MFDNVFFERSVFRIGNLPQNNLPEVILCGRSNVGKSSCINSLFNRKDLARISATPGKTRSINYYNIDEVFYLIDLPGYGYSKTSKKERENWAKLILDFISKSENIKLAIHLIDSRHAPTELDIKLNEFLNFARIPYIVLLSKADKLNQSDYKRSEKNLKSIFPELILNENLFFYSAKKGRGKKEVLRRFSNLFYLK